MAEKLTKTAIKEELARRIGWFERSCGFTEETSLNDVWGNAYNAIHYGRYRALLEMRWQIENNLFIGGFVS